MCNVKFICLKLLEYCNFCAVLWVVCIVGNSMVIRMLMIVIMINSFISVKSCEDVGLWVFECEWIVMFVIWLGKLI